MTSKTFRRLTAVVAALVVMLLATGAAANPINFSKGATCEVPSGRVVILDPGRYIPEPDWTDLDHELKRLQDQETRLLAENHELRKPDPTPWKVVLVGTLLGIAAGAYAFRK